jgi:DNA repair protein RecN (Recombination protein N)
VLRQLHISGIGVIDDLDLELHPGLNVLTGETGAGKTMITVALSLALGARGNARLVRVGASSGRVQARFDAPLGAEEWAEDGEVILARTIGADAKSGARIGGQLATASALADLGRGLVEVLGQHQSLRLLDAATQTAFVDRYAGVEHLAAVAGYSEAFAAWIATRHALEALRAEARDRERELDLLAYQVREIEAVGPEPEETVALEAEEARLGHAERLLELAAAVEEVLVREDGAVDSVASAGQGLGAIAGLDQDAARLAERVQGLVAEVGELAHDVRAYRESLALDPARLDEVRLRIAALRSLQRKYGDTDVDVLRFLAEASERVASLAGADERLMSLELELDVREREVAEWGAALTEGRVAATPRLSGELTSELRELGMPTATIEVALEPLPKAGPMGTERAELRFRGGEGQPSLGLTEGASGGELSRIMLACRSVLADVDDVPTLVFDEVDTGIGGEAGLAVGRRLARLAATRQVLVVTHLPQIACFADLHVRVRKDGGAAEIEVLDDDDRVRELSRMLAGLESSSHAVSHAEELLAEASRVRERA